MSVVVIGEGLHARLTAAVAAAFSGSASTLVTDDPSPDSWHVDVTGLLGDGNGTVLQTPFVEDVSGGDVILLGRPGELENFIANCPSLLSARSVLIVTGGVGGARVVQRLLQSATTLVGETAGFPVIGSVDGANVNIEAVKRSLPTAAVEPSRTPELLDRFHWLPDLAGHHLVETSLAQINPVIHPAISITNASRISRGEHFRFYREGLSEAASRLLEALDRERLAVFDRLGLPQITCAGWLKRFYRDQGITGESITELLSSFPPFETVPGPPHLEHRYLQDDITYGLAPLMSVAQHMAVDVPVMTSLVCLGGAVVGRELTGSGRDADLLGLQNDLRSHTTSHPHAERKRTTTRTRRST